MKEYKELKTIMNAEQSNMELVWSSVDDVLNDQFVQSATNDGVTKYEKILGITPKATYTLDERKFNIFAKMNEQLPYTVEQLHSSLTSLCGADGYSVKLNANEYKLMVKLALANENNIEAVEKLLDKMIPANIVKSVQMFNTYAMLSDLSHEQMSAYTHKQIREEFI